MDEIGNLVATYGVPITLIIVFLSQLSNLITRVGPGVVEFFQKERADIREHQQKREQDEDRVRQLEHLTAMGSRTFVEDQMTEMAAYQQVEAAAANEFIRKDVSTRQDMIYETLNKVSKQLDRVPAEVRDELETTLKEIGQNWQMAICHDDRTVQGNV